MTHKKKSRTRKRNSVERYGIDSSPFAHRPTQQKLAALLGESKANLLRLVNYKAQFISRKTITTRGKQRNLAFPVARLRTAHEILKHHLKKVQQPSYLFSPRVGMSQRDNAALHLDSTQFLSFDIKQFYPSTTSAMVRKWLKEELKMYPDVAGLLTRLVTVDEVVSFGSPVTPVLCTLVHRRMFDQIANLCDERGLKYSIWVDDVTISGMFVPGDLLTAVREIIRRNGLRTHKIKYRTGSRPVFVTGVGICGPHLITSHKMNLALKDLWLQFHEAKTVQEKEDCAQRLLTQLGSARYVVGPNTARGRKIASEMNSVRQKVSALRKTNKQEPNLSSDSTTDDLPFNL